MPDVTTNDEQIANWNEKSGPKWVAMQERLDAQLETFSRAILDRAALKTGERVLDIGCGCGSTTIDAAARVAPGGSSTGVDVSRPMLARARELATAAAVNNVSFIEGDAQVFAFPAGDTDAVISRFGVMFFADPVAAFTNIRRALKPGGRMCFLCWRPMAENPWMHVPLRGAAQHLEIPPPASPTAPGPFAFADAERVRGILTSAGYTGVQVDRHDSRLPIGNSGDLDEAVEFSLNLGPASALLMNKSDELRQKVRASIREALKPYLTPQGVVVDWAAWLVGARNA